VIDPELLAYDYDEEANGFAEPPRASAPSIPPLQRLAGAGVALGTLAFVLAAAGALPTGGWGVLLGSLGLASAAAAVWYYLDFAGTEPGVKHDDTFFRGVQNRGLVGWALGILITGFYVVLYLYDDLLGQGMPAVLEGATRLCDPLAQLLTGAPASRWFLYGLLYTLAIGVFGVRMWMKYRHNRYQRIRTLSVFVVQLGFAFLIPNLLKLFHQPEFYFSYFWPLKREYLFPNDLAALRDAGGLGQFMAFWGVGLALVGVPVLTYYFGKRWYCSWVCGCGGLAETLGDPWRQQSSKSDAAWRVERWMIHAVLVLIVVTTALLWVNSATAGRVLGDASLAFSKFYGFWIGAIFSGVVGVGFYPLLGSRVWCRFGCPQAAILGILQRLFSRFRITTNGGQCMSCGNCSTYCEMGIDVRAYAQRGENIVRASCVGCGICSAVCPRGVLKLENGATTADRYPGADAPLADAFHSLQRMDKNG
jgi:polyferredoxin